MRNRKTQIKILTLIFVVLIFGLIYFYVKFPENIKLELFVALVVTFITIYFSVNKNWLDHDKIFIDLFHQMNEKFDLINDDLNQIRDDDQFKPEERSKESVIQDYLNLCSEEYLWYKKGRVDESVWKAWRKGMDYYLESSFIKDYFKKQKKYNISYYGFFDEIKF